MTNWVVSLFTREWIEIEFASAWILRCPVSLFTREWIEIAIIFCRMSFVQSPSLRGSGLKLINIEKCCFCCWRLPLYEGVDWNWFPCYCTSCTNMSPSLRGSGLKFCQCKIVHDKQAGLPLYEGVDWNTSVMLPRSWSPSLPLYEGVDWNKRFIANADRNDGLPLYEGVDWNRFCQWL